MKNCTFGAVLELSGFEIHPTFVWFVRFVANFFHVSIGVVPGSALAMARW